MNELISVTNYRRKESVEGDSIWEFTLQLSPKEITRLNDMGADLGRMIGNVVMRRAVEEVEASRTKC